MRRPPLAYLLDKQRDRTERTDNGSGGSRAAEEALCPFFDNAAARGTVVVSCGRAFDYALDVR